MKKLTTNSCVGLTPVQYQLAKTDKNKGIADLKMEHIYLDKKMANANQGLYQILKWF